MRKKTDRNMIAETIKEAGYKLVKLDCRAYFAHIYSNGKTYLVYLYAGIDKMSVQDAIQRATTYSSPID